MLGGQPAGRQATPARAASQLARLVENVCTIWQGAEMKRAMQNSRLSPALLRHPITQTIFNPIAKNPATRSCFLPGARIAQGAEISRSNPFHTGGAHLKAHE